jgi:hypothetical protein
VKSLVIYESEYGNTEKIARAIAEALGKHGEARVTPVSSIADLGTEGRLDFWQSGLPRSATTCQPPPKSCWRALLEGGSLTCAPSRSTRAIQGQGGSPVPQLER